MQSHVPAHAQLGWVLQCLTGFGEARRMTQFKDKSAKGGEGAASRRRCSPTRSCRPPTSCSTGRSTSRSARTSASTSSSPATSRRFNHRYKKTFRLPEPYILKETAKITDLQDPTAKMSKSASSPAGIVELLDDPKVSAKKIRRAVTDSGTEVRFDEEEKPGVSNLLTIYSALTGADRRRPRRRRTPGAATATSRATSPRSSSTFVTPFRDRTLELLDDRAQLDAILAPAPSGPARSRSGPSPTSTSGSGSCRP